ncbi:DNA repair protein RadA [Aliikangiella sp. G2MR2-5]|uniref:DNA repair protein RadA n=1 Tax=Aliikangiella sp. G2MR2-5 TaxID=2788943 RepID=UPI0018AB7F8B|nr:DNA repair protein RadA [Aliikangiella sp. G2MR2-5]
MSKVKTQYVCTECGAVSPKWSGQCMECQQWNCLVEQVENKKPAQNARFAGYAGAQKQLQKLSEVKHEETARIPTGLGEFDRVLGGGLVAGSVVLIGGDPGIGKSTILLQSMCKLSESLEAVYVTGEESAQQISMRASRLGLNGEKLSLLTETQVETIIATAQQVNPHIMVIDSIQTIYTELLQSAPGGVAQVRESTAQLVRFAKQKGIALFVVGHVTKDGALAGPRVLEHMVDAVLYFEGERDGRYRILRAVKNRFGAVNELGVFAMMEEGLKEVQNPSAIFLSRYQQAAAGSVVTVTWEGSRPLLVEVQALVDESHLGNPRRVAVGLEQNRLAMLLAVLSRHGGVFCQDQDVFLNVVGGVRVMETSADLALVCAVTSSLRNQILPQSLIIFGEVGLAGEIRPVPNGQERIKEAKKHGFEIAIVPKANVPKKVPEGIKVIAVSQIGEALAALTEI